ncbi:MAG: D-alanyl-D-alanine carboxypeptidase/D-alanyl-D-alanine-endopeptidase [Myxococcales bacterium]|nr:D-alanyl-D-alanine carboxypeptidase/D-alanyl-D-alanine-endopeptidase [Myxococcales bacterium]
MKLPSTKAALLALVVAAAAPLGCLRPSELQVSRFVDDADEEALRPRFVGIRVIPAEEGPPTPGERLEARLGAFAAAVEDYIERYEPALPPIDFDRSGLSAALSRTIERLEDEAMVSIHVRDLASNETIFDYYGDTPLNPASNLKLVTASAAIDLLGSDYTFATEIRASDDALVLIGAGDPSLTADALDPLIAEIADEVRVSGLEKIIVDDSVFSQRRFGPGYRRDGPGYTYEAISGALSLNFNSVVVTVYPVSGSSRPAVRVEPPSTHVVIENNARIGGSTSRIAVETRAQGDKTVVSVSGRMPARSRPVSIRRRVYDPSRFAAGAVAQRLADLTGTEPLPIEIGEAPADAEVLIVHHSPPLIEIADDLLAYSNNFMAEQLVRTLGYRMTGEPGDWENGLEVLRGYWSALGNDPDALIVENASGLSEVGRVTTSGLVDLIAMADRLQGEGPSLIDALPVAGVEGTMKARLRLSGKRVRAKTGTLDGVSGLSGVITAEDGTPQVAFSILINVKKEGSPLVAKRRREAEDKIVMTVLRYLDEYESRRGFYSFEPLWVYATEREDEEAAEEPEEGGEAPAIEAPTIDAEAGAGDSEGSEGGEEAAGEAAGGGAEGESASLGAIDGRAAEVAGAAAPEPAADAPEPAKTQP